MAEFRHEREDMQLITLARQGDPKALADLISRHMKYIQKRAGEFFVSSLEQDDLTSEGLYGLFSALGTYDETKGVPFASYARTCINNAMISAAKAQNRLKQKPLSNYVSWDDEEMKQQFYRSDDDPEGFIIDKEDYQTTMDIIENSLSDYERQVLSFYLEGLSYDEIAWNLGVSAKSVDNAVQRIRKKLKPIIQD